MVLKLFKKKVIESLWMKNLKAFLLVRPARRKLHPVQVLSNLGFYVTFLSFDCPVNITTLFHVMPPL
jgi:hypothetical protein